MGGTFDPVHNGHIRNARLLAGAFGHPVRLVPAGDPGHRDAPVASAEQRLEMLRLAVGRNEQVILDECELQRGGKTFTVDTLELLRAQMGAEQPIAWVVGADAVAGLHRWKRWERLLQLAHLVIIGRPNAAGGEPAPEVALALADARCDSPQQLHARPAGCVLRLTLAELDISASRVREKLAGGESVKHLLPQGVEEYIDSEGIYRG